MGSKTTPAGNTTTTQNTSPWAPQQPYLTNIFGSAQNLYNTGGPEYFPGATYAAPTSYENQGLDLLGSTGLWAGTAGAQPALGAENSFLSGSELNTNPALASLGSIGSQNLAQNNWSYGVLKNQTYGNAPTDAAIAGIPATVGDASDLAKSNLGTTQNLAYGSIAPTQSAISNAVGGASPTLGAIANANGIPLGYGALNELTNIATGGVPMGYGALSELGGFATGPNIAQMGQSYDTLRDFAAGKMSGNPETGALAQSVLSSVLPSIQKQFIEGGGLSSPEAAYASTQGATAALAPTLFQQWQEEQRNQLAGATTLEQAKLQGRGLQQQAAQAQGAQAVASANAQREAAQAQGAQALASANTRANAALGFGNLGITGAQAAQAAALNPALGVGSLGLNTGLGLGNLGLSGASTTGQLGLGEQANVENAANTLANQELQGQQNQIAALSGQGGLYSSAENNRLQALGLYPSTTNTYLGALSTAAGAGQSQQQLQQQAINDMVQRWNYEQTLPYQKLNELVGQISGNYGGTTSLTQPFYNNTGANIGAGVLGGLGAANAIGGSSGIFPGAIASLFSLFSDRRMKTDVTRVGTLENGLSVYIFRYFGEGPFQMGLMADEVWEKHPNAVREAFGYKMVDYALAVL